MLKDDIFPLSPTPFTKCKKNIPSAHRNFIEHESTNINNKINDMKQSQVQKLDSKKKTKHIKQSWEFM